jgi:RNA polymerase sigma factor (TIGR02999 family)
MSQPAGDFTRRWQDLRQGNREAVEELIYVFYPQLHRMASGQLRRERAGHTWQPTALLNELYLELIKMRAHARESAQELAPPIDGEQAFLAFAGHLMKRLLIVHSRPLYRRVDHVPANEFDLREAPGPDMDGVHDVEAAMAGLGGIDPELRRMVELRVFEGLTMEDAARRLGCSERTAARRWDFAKHWLRDFFRQ